MNPVSASLKPGISYTWMWNILSRFFAVESTITKHWSVLICVENENVLKQYQKLCDYFQIPFFGLETESQLIWLTESIPWLYGIVVDTLEKTISSRQNSLLLRVWDTQGVYKDIENITKIGYSFSAHGGKGTYTRQWDILSIIDPDGYYKYIVNYWWDEIESINMYRIQGDVTLKKYEKKKVILGSTKSLFSDTYTLPLQDILSTHSQIMILDHVEFYKDYKSIIERNPDVLSFDILGDSSREIVPLCFENLEIQTLEAFKHAVEETSKDTYIYTKHTKLIQDFLQYNEIHWTQVIEVSTHILKSFEQGKLPWNNKGLRIICDDIINKVFTKKRVKRRLSEDVDLLLKIKKWDYVIHIDHGIGVFHEIVTREIGNATKEYVELHYKEEDKLFVPITEVSRISKYVWVENPKLTPLSGKLWEKKIQKVREDIQHIAEELLKNFAERKLRSGIAFENHEEKISDFQSRFPYTYTPCQQSVIDEILEDMQKETTMDRLLVGDVGFWKTEVAFNTIYNAVINRRQVAFICPLVVLAYEHYEKAIERFAWLWVNVEILTRMESQKNVTRILAELKKGSVDIVIGTHRLLWKNIQFKNLWLIVIDEEHKFWVQDKEKIKSMKVDIDVLAMSATPIPRSLNLALSGIRDISVLKTPPEGRKNIETLISPYEEKVIQDAGNKEFDRGGQVFFVHNRVVNIEVYQKNIQKLFPNKKIIITHGQLPGDDLENRIMDFKSRKYDILLSTTVIENGIDFSNVNTIFINECQSFGISQLHQLRGRVGRSEKKWYCYLLYRKENLSNETAKRLHNVVNYSYLWAGFELAMKDLEIRWWWDILGIRQSGQVQEIGVSLFLKMLEEKIQELKNDPWSSITLKKEISIDIPLSASIPDTYFQSETDKIQFYREIESLQNLDELEAMIQWFIEVNPDIPLSTQNLFSLLRVKILARDYKITAIKKVGINYQIDFIDTLDLEELKSFLKLDKQVKFQVVNIKRLRASTKVFDNDKKFLQYILDMFEKRVVNTKIKLKSKNK